MILGYGFGVFFIICGLIGYFHRRYVNQNGMDIEAMVISNIVYQHSESSDSYVTVFGYTVDGVDYETQLGTGSTERFPEGSKVPIQYRLDNPKKIVIKGDAKKNAVIEFLMVSGGILLIILSASGVIDLLFSLFD